MGGHQRFSWSGKLVPLSLLLVLLGGFIWYVRFYVESFDLDSSNGSCGLEEMEHSNVVESYAYTWLVRHRASVQPEGDVVVVTLSPQVEPLNVLSNVCDGRKFLSLLVPALARLHASVITVDKFYSEGACDPKRSENKQFVMALNNVSEQVPVITGQAAHRAPSATEKSEESCLALTQRLSFTQPPAPGRPFRSSKVLYGLTRLNENTLQIPLAWPVLPLDSSKTPEIRKGIALVSAEQFRLTHAGNHAVALPTNDLLHHPFALLRADLPHWSAMDILCNTSNRGALKAQEWDAGCNIEHRSFDDIQGKVVMIGEQVSTDLQPFPNKKRYGVDLQAGYVDALLSGQFLKGLPSWLDWGMVFFWAGLFTVWDFWARRFLGKFKSFHHSSHKESCTEGAVVLGGVALLLLLCTVSISLLASRGIYTPVFVLSLYPIGTFLILRASFFVLTIMRERQFPSSEAL